MLAKDPEHAIKVVMEILDLLSTGKLKPLLYDKEYNGLETVGEALQDLEDRKTWGKGVVRVRQSASSTSALKREAKL